MTKQRIGDWREEEAFSSRQLAAAGTQPILQSAFAWRWAGEVTEPSRRVAKRRKLAKEKPACSGVAACVPAGK